MSYGNLLMFLIKQRVHECKAKKLIGLIKIAYNAEQNRLLF